MASLVPAHVAPRCCIIYPLLYAAERLPVELVTEILKYLDLGDLWRAAAVSRRFYTSAWYAGLYIRRNLWWRNDGDYKLDVDVLREVVQHALHHDLRLALSFRSGMATKFDPAAEDLGRNNSLALTTTILEILSQITTSLPVLVRLELAVTNSFGACIRDALRHPAPRLMSFLMIYYFPLYVPEEQVFSQDLFAGFAPQLHRVALRDVPLGADPIPAFSRVSNSDIYYEDVFPDIDIGGQFPSLDSLCLAACSLAETSYTPPRLTLGGIALKKLVVADCEELSLIPALDRATKLHAIPVIEHEAEFIVWTDSEAMWHWKPKDHACDSDELSIRLMHSVELECGFPDTSIHIIVPQHRRRNRNWRRTFRLREYPRGSPCPIHDIPDIGKHLTYLRMDNTCLTGFLECDGLALDALRNLQVDFKSALAGTAATTRMLWPPDALDSLDDGERAEVSFGESDRSAPTFDIRPSYSRIHCRNLETLRLFALDAPLLVDSRAAAFLGRALSQLARPPKERAALDLAGVIFREPIARALIGQTFASIRWGYASAVEVDGDLWDGCV